jgi:hypothetical protein
LAGVQHLERAFRLDGLYLHGAGFRRLHHIHAGADTDAHFALDFQRDQRFAHGGTGNAELVGEVALGRQTRARGELALLDQRAKLIRHLSIQAPMLDGFERHASSQPRRVQFNSGLLVRPVDRLLTQHLARCQPRGAMH